MFMTKNKSFIGTKVMSILIKNLVAEIPMLSIYSSLIDILLKERKIGLKKVNENKKLRDMVEKFKLLIKRSISTELINFIDKRNVNELTILKLVCKKKEFAEPERINEFLNTKIQLKQDKINSKISICGVSIAFVAMIVSIIALIKSCLLLIEY